MPPRYGRAPANPKPKKRVVSPDDRAVSRATPPSQLGPVATRERQPRSEPLKARPPPVPILQQHGFHDSLAAFRERLALFTDTHEEQFGYKPSAGLAFDVARSKVEPQRFGDLLQVPQSRRAAEAKRAVSEFLPERGGIIEKQGVLEEAVRGTVERMPLTDEEVESNLIDEYLAAVRAGREAEYLRGEHGPNIVRLLETRPNLKHRAYRAETAFERERITAGAADLPAKVTGEFLKGGLQIVGGLALGPPVLVYEEIKGGKKSVEQRSLKPLGKTQLHLAEMAAKGIWQDIQHPGDNWGFLALDIFGATAITRGGYARVKSGKPLKKPKGGRIEYRRGGQKEYEVGSENLFANDLQRLKAWKLNRRMEERRLRGEGPQTPPSGLLSVIRPRWLADKWDDVLDSTLTRHLSGERKMGRLAAHRRRIERSMEEAPIKELQHVDRAAPLQQRLNRVRRLVPGLTVGEQKALQIKFSDLEGDSISKLRQWKEFHEHVIANADDVAVRLGFDRSYAPIIQENHRAQLQALALAEKVFKKKKPSRRMDEAERLTRQLEAEATALKIREMGLAPDVAAGRIAAVGDVVRGKKSLDRDKEAPGERVSDDSLYTQFTSRARSKKETKLEQRLTAGPRVGQYWMPAQDLHRLLPELNHAFTGKAIELGDFRIDTTRLVAEATARTFRAGAKIREWKHLLKGSTERPTGSGFDIPIATGSAKNIPPELKKILAQVDEGHIDASAAEFLAKVEDKSLLEHLFPGTDPATGKLIGKGPIAGVRWVDRRMVMGLNVLPSLPDTPMKRAFQLVQEPVRDAILFARPAYGLNIPSNAGMLIIQQGPWTGNNLVRGLYSNRIYGDRIARQLDALAGEGPNLSLVNLDIKWNALVVGRTMAQLWHKWADGWMRRAAVVHEIHRQGFKGKKGFEEFLNKPEHAAARAEVGERAQGAMIKFSNLTEFEKQGIRNVMFIYPFRSRGLVWSLRTIRDHPAQTDILAHIGDEGAEDIREEIEKRIPDQMQEAVKKWFGKTGFFPISWDGDTPTVVNPASINTFSLLHDTVHFWDSPSAILRDLGPAAKVAVFSATGRDEYGNELPGPRVIDAFAKVVKDLPHWRAYERGGKAALQKPLPPLDKSDREQMVARRRKALEQVVLGPGWMNGFGTLITGGLTPREINTDAIFARFWRELPMEERHKIEMEFLRDALAVQAKFMQRPLPKEVGKAVTVLGRIQRLRSQRQADTLKDKLSPREEIDVVLDSLQEQGLISETEAKQATQSASKLKIEDEFFDFKTGLLNKYGNRKELAKWDSDVRELWGFRKPVLQRKLQLAGVKQKLTQSQAELFEVGRKYIAYADEVNKRKKLVEFETGHDKKHLEAELRAWMEGQKPVKGIDFNMVGWANQKPHERQEHLRSAATAEWESLSSFDKELLGKKGKYGEAWAVYQQAIADHIREQPFDERTIKADQRLNLAKQVNGAYPGFIRDWDFARKRTFARLKGLSPVRDSKNKADWLWLLGQAQIFAQAVDNEVLNERDAKEQWKDALVVLRPWIADNLKSFDRELLVYERQKKSFLSSLLERGRP